MRRLLLMVLLVLVSGCTARPPSVTEPPSAKAKLASPPSASAGVVRRGDGWAVVGLKHALVWYMWSPDTSWVAFNTPRGMWAVSADGRTEHLLAPGDAWRELAGWWQGALVFLEHREGGSMVAVARPGEPMREVAIVRGPMRPEHMFVGVSALYGRYLALFPPGEVALRVDLDSGSVEQLPGFEVPVRCGYFAPSLGGRHLLASDMCEAAPVRLIDLENWTVREAGSLAMGGAMGGIWSPVAERWAGLADGYLAVGDPSGQFRKVPTPHPMKHRQGPVWSADGQHLALMEETGPSPNGNPRYAACAIWTVSLETGQWRQLAEVASTHVLGWHPSDRYLVIQEMVGAGTAHFGLLSPEGGTIEWLSQLPTDSEYATRVDERLLVVATWGLDYGTTLYREVAGRMIPLRAGQLPYMDYLQIRPPFRSWVDLSGSATDTTLEVGLE